MLTNSAWRWPSWSLSLRTLNGCVTAFSPFLGNGKHFPFLYFKRTVVIPPDYTGYRNFHRPSSVVVFATMFKQMPNWVFPVAQSAIDNQ